MSVIKKYIIAVVLAFAVFAVAMYLVATDDIMLLDPKIIASNYQTCQKVVSITQTDRNEETDLFCIDSVYVDSNDGYDYFFETYFEAPKYIADYFVKKKGKEIVSAFCLQKLVPPIKQNEINDVHGFYNNGYLYFTVKEQNSIYRIDDRMEKGSVYFTPKKFGEIVFSSFCINDNKFYYITESRKLVEFDGKVETQIGELPEMDSMTLIEPTYGKDLFQHNFPVNCIGGVFYYGLYGNLFSVDENNNTVCIDLHLSKRASDESNVFRIEPCKENERLIIASYAFFDWNPEIMHHYYRYIINPKTGHYIKLRQKTKNRYNETSKNEILAYIENLNLKAGIDGQMK